MTHKLLHGKVFLRDVSSRNKTLVIIKKLLKEYQHTTFALAGLELVLKIICSTQGRIFATHRLSLLSSAKTQSEEGNMENGQQKLVLSTVFSGGKLQTCL